MVKNIDARIVTEIVAENPRRSAVFEQNGIDVCCSGKCELSAVCRLAGLELREIIRQIEEVDRGQIEHPENWLSGSLPDLVNHIAATHHGYVRDNLPRILKLADKVCFLRGAREPQYVTLRRILHQFGVELESHIEMEEQILFPLIATLDAPDGRLLHGYFSVATTAQVMDEEHDRADGLLLAMRELTNGFTPPAGACNATRALMDALGDLDADLRAHFHKESAILFPRAIAAERAIG